MADGPHAATQPSEPEPLVGPFGRRALRIGRVFGIDVGLDLSWIAIFALITLSLAQQLAAEHADWSAQTRWSGALAGSLAFFLSILLHELGHSVVSNALGVPVRSITLFLFGGLASLSKEPERPRDEFLIGAAGPAVSLLLGASFLLAGWLLPGAPLAFEVASAVLGWLGLVNLALAFFNLFPGFPLDGGHLLRAGLWAATGDFVRATRISAGAGKVFAAGLIGLGILIGFTSGNLFSGLWLVLIGWFVLGAARGTGQRAVLESRLAGLSVEQAMERAPPSVSRATSVAEVVEGPVLRQGLRWVLVRDHEQLVGLVTLRELHAVPAEERARTPVGQVMLRREQLPTVAPSEGLWNALQRVQGAGGLLLVVDEAGAILGVLTQERLRAVVRNQLELRKG